MKIKRQIFRLMGYAFFALGAVGTVLPLLPTTGPWILAVFFLWKGDDPLANRLLRHPKLGRPLQDWFEHGAISKEGKIAACFGMALSVVLMLVLGAPLWITGLVALVLLGVALWLLSRPAPEVHTTP